jgi:putative membrane protein
MFDNMPQHRSYALVLLTLLIVLGTGLAIDPHYRQDWLLENALAAAFVGILIVTYRSMPLSRISYTLIFVFLCLHEIGAHYTYSEVPYERGFQDLIGISLNNLFGWQRNNFDRVVHFSYGLLLAYPVREVFLRVASVRGFWGYFLPLDVAMSTSVLYELIEWGAAAGLGGELGAAYLGTQGDVWDAQKDMALASLGAAVTMTITAVVNMSFQRDFTKDWLESLRVKRQAPLGEVELARMIAAKKAGSAPRSPRQ